MSHQADSERELSALKGRSSLEEQSRHISVEPGSLRETVKLHGLLIATSVRAVNAALCESWMRDHSAGSFMNSGRLAEAIGSDGRVATALETRASILSDLWCPELVSLVPSQRSLPQSIGADSSSVREWWRRNLFRILTRKTVREMDAEKFMMGFSIHQIVYDDCSPEELFDRGPSLQSWHPALTAYFTADRNFRAITSDDGYHPVPPQGNASWWVCTRSGKEGCAYRCWMSAGVMQLWSTWLSKEYALVDWNRYIEQYADPAKLANMPVSAEAEDKQRFMDALKNLGPGAVIPCLVQPDGLKWGVEFAAPKGDSTDTISERVAYCDRQIDAIVLGTTSMIDSQTSAAYGATETRWRGMALSKSRLDAQDLEADAQTLIDNVTELMFGHRNLAPTLRIDYGSIEDTSGARDSRLGQGKKTMKSVT